LFSALPTFTLAESSASQQTSKWCSRGKRNLCSSYNRYLAIAARVVRRSLKEEQRLAAERRGEMELRFAKWSNGKQGDVENLAAANAAVVAEAAPSGSPS